MKKMSLAEQRKEALSAAWGLLKKLEKHPEDCSIKDAETVLDELARKDRKLIASQWYLTSGEGSENQWKLFTREWNARCRLEKADNIFLARYSSKEKIS